MNAQHTPTPWFAEQDAIFSRNCAPNPMGYYRVASCGMVHGAISNYADAAFIVTACNAHDDLVAALRTAREDLGELVQCRHSSDICNCNEHCRLRDIDAALAKAGAA